MIIAIDGSAASGKGTLAKELAQHLGYDYLDTGALYRAVALSLLNNGMDENNICENQAVKCASSLNLALTQHQNPLRCCGKPCVKGSDIAASPNKIACVTTRLR